MHLKPVQPRTARYTLIVDDPGENHGFSLFDMTAPPLMLGLGTWLESDEITYPSGSMIRRARAFNTENGQLLVVRCGIANSFFSVPVRGGGFLATSNGGVLLYHPLKKGHSPTKGIDQSNESE